MRHLFRTTSQSQRSETRTCKCCGVVEVVRHLSYIETRNGRGSAVMREYFVDGVLVKNAPACKSAEDLGQSSLLNAGRFE